ncbi:hypothetical protein GCM10010413_50130 [Promicromonospora sukumoe]|uniref:HNH endonuclease n=1 Tax=Promicromonospora sukumoe TaxID=88382 RepID=A0A7W3PBY6_9MICO|nr:HNH endonuclease signature motif containing protein [Promicromonospora sukumoe]MBA8806355.1 hypothetical protein [Promicromonospora sukumoe]
MTNAVRYRNNGDNRVLRHMLRIAWDRRCYWCREFKGYLELEIDHILPKSSTNTQRQRLQKAFGVPDDFDVHAVYNLAPICGDCNKLKTDEDLTQKGVVLSHLKQAQRLAPDVTRSVHAFGRASKLGEALLVAAEVDLTDSDTQATFEEGAPAIVQRLAELGDGKADYWVHREVTVEAEPDDHTFLVMLNERGRAALEVLETVAGGDLDADLSGPISALFRQAENAIANTFRVHDDGVGAPEVGSVSIDWPLLSIDAMRYSSAPPAEIEFVFEGTLEGVATASVVRDRDDGSGLEDAQGEAMFSCRFTFELAWQPSDGAGQFHFDGVWLEDFTSETFVDGKRSHV